MDLNLAVETPEQIEIDFEVAGIGSRVLSTIIDTLVMSLLLLVGTVAPFLLISSAREAAETLAENLTSQKEEVFKNVNALGLALVFLSFFVIQWGYFIAAELLTDGRSPGKRAVGLRVVRVDGLPIGFAESVIRNLVRAVDLLPGTYGVGLFAMLFGRKVQRLGDLAAGTIVIKERAGQKRRSVGPVPVPEPVPAFAETRIARVLSPNELALLVGFCQRAHELAPAARFKLAAQIAAILRPRFGDTSNIDDESWLFSLSREVQAPPP